MNGAVVRIILRYVVGGVFGAEIGDALAGDPDVVMIFAVGGAAVIEWTYSEAKKRGWKL